MYRLFLLKAKTKKQLYLLLNYWFSSTFNDGTCQITFNDKDLGTIIAQGFIGDIAKHVGGVNVYYVDIKPVIKCDIKDNKVRIICTIPFYLARILEGDGVLGAFDDMSSRLHYATWALDEYYPFAKKDSHKRASAKAFVMAYCYSNVLIDKIEECLKH